MEELEVKRNSEADLLRLSRDGAPPLMSCWRHVKTGGVYRVYMHALREEDGTPLVVYSRVGGDLNWTRPTSEFMDGRFVRLTDDVPT